MLRAKAQNLPFRFWWNFTELTMMSFCQFQAFIKICNMGQINS